MRRMMFIFSIMLAAVLSSCERRPLLDLYNTHYVRVYIDEHLLNVTTGFYNPDHQKPVYTPPSIIRVALTDPKTGAVKSERYLRNMEEDERGRYYDGYIIADPGHYNMMAYNFDTEATVIGSANSHLEAKAYTNEIASHLYSKIPSRVKAPHPDERIVYEPDHLFVVDCGDVFVDYVDHLDTLKTPEGDHFTGKSIVKSYYLQVKVKGMEYASSSVSLLDGMAGSTMLKGCSMNADDKVTIYFEMLKSEPVAEDEAVIYATFNTFGKLPDTISNLEITFDFITTYGKHYSEKLDITHKFKEPDAIDHQWIILDHTITIPDPPAPEPGSGGGFMPEVGPWEDIETDIII